MARPRSVTDSEIFAAVTATITDHGPTGATMDNIAARLGLTGPALSHRFGNKRHLMLAFAERQTSATEELFAAERERHTNPLDALVAALTSLGAHLATKTAAANNLAMLTLDLIDPEFGQHAIQQSRAIRRLTAELAVEAGLTTTSKSEQMAEDLYTTWSGAILTWAIDGTDPFESWLRRHIERTIDHWTS